MSTTQWHHQLFKSNSPSLVTTSTVPNRTATTLQESMQQEHAQWTSQTLIKVAESETMRILQPGVTVLSYAIKWWAISSRQESLPVFDQCSLIPVLHPIPNRDNKVIFWNKGTKNGVDFMNSHTGGASPAWPHTHTIPDKWGKQRWVLCGTRSCALSSPDTILWVLSTPHSDKYSTSRVLQSITGALHQLAVFITHLLCLK